MPRARRIAGEAAVKVGRLVDAGVSDARISLELAKDGLVIDASSVRRWRLAAGKPRSASPRGRATQTPRPVPNGAHAGSSEPQSADEKTILLENLTILRADLQREIPASDRARVSSEIRSICQRLTALDALDRAEGEGDEETAASAAIVMARLERHAAVKREQEQGRRVLIEALAAELPEPFRTRLRQLAAGGLGPGPGDPPAPLSAHFYDADEEGDHAATG